MKAMAKRQRTDKEQASGAPPSEQASGAAQSDTAYVFDSSTDTSWLARMTAALQAQSSSSTPTDVNVRTYVSQPNHLEMKVYKHKTPSWVCDFCSAEWNFIDTGAPENAGVTCQIAYANGGQLRMWPEGLQGMCKDCKTVWLYQSE